MVATGILKLTTFFSLVLALICPQKTKENKKRRKGIYSHSQCDMVAQVVRGALVVPLVPLDLEALPGQSVLMSPPVLVHPESP